MPKESWCIVGGGMLGLSLAHRLASDEREITVLEAADHFGGLADAWQIGPHSWDRHYHVTLLSDLNLRGVLADIGLEGDLRWTTTKTDFYTGGQFHPLNNVVDYLNFPPLGLIDKARLAATIVYASMIRNGTRLEGIPVGDWLTRISGKRVYERIWKPLLRAKLGENHTIASASFIWSVINRFYAARRSGLKTEMFGYVRGGYARIMEELVAHLQTRGVHCLADRPVRRISRVNKRLRVETPHGTHDYDRVIVTAAGPIAARMCPTLPDQERKVLSDLRYQGVVCASVLLRKPLRNRYLTYIADESIPLTGVIEMTAVVDRAEFAGNSLVYLPQYVPCDDPLFDADDDELRATRLAPLFRMYRHITEDDIVAFRVSRARNVLAVQGLNYSSKVPAIHTSIPGLHIVTSAQIINGNLNVDETIGLANRAAGELAALTPAALTNGQHYAAVAAE